MLAFGINKHRSVLPPETSKHFRNIFRFSKFGNVEQGNKKWDYPRKTGILGGATIYVFGFPAEKVEFLKTLPKVLATGTKKDFVETFFVSKSSQVNRDLSSYHVSYYLQLAAVKSHQRRQRCQNQYWLFPRHGAYIKSHG